MQRPVSQRSTTRLAVWLLLLSVLALPARATVLLELGFGQLVAQSEFIFVGTVTASRTEAQGEQLYTITSLTVDDAVKGAAPSATIELRFLGNDVDGDGMQVEGQFIPPVGAHGVFFVANLTDRLVNPLTGWQQGYFPLTSDENGVAFLDMRQRPDLAIPGLEVEPLVEKMRGIGFSAEAINEKFPRAFLFSLEDFRVAIIDESRRNGDSP